MVYRGLINIHALEAFLKAQYNNYYEVNEAMTQIRKKGFYVNLSKLDKLNYIIGTK